MSEEIKPSAIKETQDALSKYVRKPPLTEKLLKKPPFRYLHDIVTVIIKETGFLDGLYTAEELDSNNVKDKESKIAFLDKLINAVKTATGKNITVRSAKIVAGLEVNKTLELLQLIGKAIDEKERKVDTTQVVEEHSKKSDTKPRKLSKDESKEKKTNENVRSNDPASKPKTNSTKTATEAKTSVSTKKPTSNSNTDENTKQRRNSVTIKRDALKKEPTAENASNDAIPQIKEPSKQNKISTAKNRAPSKESTLIKRNAAQSKSTPVHRNSLKDTSRNAISSAKNVQSVIKEEKEENDQHASTKPQPTKGSNKTADTKNTAPKKDEKLALNALPEQDATGAIIKSDQIRENSIDKNDSKVENTTATLEESEKADKASARRKHSINTERPGSARPGSRKPAQNDVPSKNSSQNDTQNENKEKGIDEAKNRIPSSIRPRTATRPPSARPGAPRIRDRGEVSVVDEVSAPTNSINVIEEGKQDQFGDDKDSFIVIESEQMPPLRLQSEPSLEMKETEQGQLVHQILKTQKELNESVASDVTQNKHLEIEWEAGREREKYIVAKEIGKIRASIQTLTSAANPLGKLFDFLQEDVDEMQRELQHWKNVNEKLQKQQLAELEFAKISLQPLQKQLLEVENSIQEEYLQIANMKMIILNNDEKLMKLVTSTATKTRVK